MIKIAYFSNQFADAQGHGLARYARELHAALVELEEVLMIPIAAWSSLPRRELDELRARSGLQISALGRKLTPAFWNYLNLPPVEYLLNQEVDVVHAVSLGYPIATRKPFIVTVHDLGPLTHPEYFSNTRPWVMERSLRQAERQADAIICVSQSTADEVCGYLGDGIADRIRIVHEGVSDEFSKGCDDNVFDGLKIPAASTPFVLTAGKLSPRKNVEGVLRAMTLLAGEIPHHLVLVGGSGWDIEQVLCELAVPDLRSKVHVLDYVTDQQLRALYKRAELYVHPSLYEGFGLTILEAMASGTPVVTSNLSSLPEVAGSAAILVDPRDDVALANAMMQVLTDNNLAKQLSSAGCQRANLFSWNDCARKTGDIYSEVAR